MCRDCDDEAYEGAWHDEHAACERCSWIGRETILCNAGDAHPSDRLCHGKFAAPVMIDELPFCATCALVIRVFLALGANDWDDVNMDKARDDQIVREGIATLKTLGPA